jgi:hypothetical protein
MKELLIPLTHLALEVDATADDLATKLADLVLVDDIGRRAIDRDTARALIVEHQAKLAAAAESKRVVQERLAADTAAAHANIPRGIPPSTYEAGRPPGPGAKYLPGPPAPTHHVEISPIERLRKKELGIK